MTTPEKEKGREGEREAGREGGRERESERVRERGRGAGRRGRWDHIVLGGEREPPLKEVKEFRKVDPGVPFVYLFELCQTHASKLNTDLSENYIIYTRMRRLRSNLPRLDTRVC